MIARSRQRGSEKKAQKELDERQKHVETLNIRPLSVRERERYQVDWTTVQGKFVDQPAQATQRGRSPDHGSHGTCATIQYLILINGRLISRSITLLW